jgi:hypothetical protein
MTACVRYWTYGSVVNDATHSNGRAIALAEVTEMLHPEFIRAIHQDRQRQIEADIRQRSLVAAIAERHAETTAGTSTRGVSVATVSTHRSGRIESSRSVTTASCAATPRVPGQLG